MLAISELKKIKDLIEYGKPCCIYFSEKIDAPEHHALAGLLEYGDKIYIALIIDGFVNIEMPIMLFCCSDEIIGRFWNGLHDMLEILCGFEKNAAITVNRKYRIKINSDIINSSIHNSGNLPDDISLHSIYDLIQKSIALIPNRFNIRARLNGTEYLDGFLISCSGNYLTCFVSLFVGLIGISVTRDFDISFGIDRENNIFFTKAVTDVECGRITNIDNLTELALAYPREALDFRFFEILLTLNCIDHTVEYRNEEGSSKLSIRFDFKCRYSELPLLSSPDRVPEIKPADIAAPIIRFLEALECNRQ